MLPVASSTPALDTFLGLLISESVTGSTRASVTYTIWTLPGRLEIVTGEGTVPDTFARPLLLDNVTDGSIVQET